MAGKEKIRAAFVKIAAYFRHSLQVGQGRIEVIETGDTALVIMEATLDYVDEAGAAVHALRRSSHVFRRGLDGGWLCVIDNSYGTDILNLEEA